MILRLIHNSPYPPEPTSGATELKLSGEHKSQEAPGDMPSKGKRDPSLSNIIQSPEKKSTNTSSVPLEFGQ